MKTQPFAAVAAMVGLLGLACGGDGVGPVDGPTPTIARVSPATGTVGTELAIVGTNFRAGASVTVGGVASTSPDVDADTVIYALVPAGIAVNTALAVSVVNSDGTSATLAAAFTAVPPTLSFVNSATKPSGNVGSTVILEGEAFGDVQGTGAVLFSDGAGGTIAATIANAGDWTNTFIVTTVPQGANDGPVVVQTGTGTSNALPFNVTDAATFSPSTINWTRTTSLPTAMSGHVGLAVPIDDAGGTTVQYVHVTGGRDNSGNGLDQIVYSAIAADGSVGSWTSTAALPSPRAFHAAVVATPFNSKVSGSGRLYVLGGVAAAGQPATTVYVGTLAQNGSVSGWSTTTPLPQPLHSHGAVVFRSAIYVAGGATVGNTPVPTVYRARIDTVGQLGAWEELPALPSARAYHGFVSFGGALYAVGGESAAVAPEELDYTRNDSKFDEVVYVKINLRNGDFAAANWTVNANSLQKRRSKHATLAAGGNLFVSSGLYAAAGTGSSENTYAQILPDGSIGAFAGATGANTLLSEGGLNLFNAAAIGYVDASGVARVMILGGDNVNNPGTPTANVLYY